MSRLAGWRHRWSSFTFRLDREHCLRYHDKQEYMLVNSIFYTKIDNHTSQETKIK